MVDRVGQQLGNYRLIRLLGQGGSGDVYLGEHVYLKTQAAIKVLQMQLASKDSKSFLEEARIIAGLVHPNIVRVLEFGVDGNVPFLVMDYASKGNLRQRHPKGDRVPLENIVYYIKQAAAALQYAHDKKLIHRDVKPENMLLGADNEVLLSDFGIAVVAHNTSSQIVQEIIGTLAYMAPEQFTGKPRPASDQYALGVIVYEWLCGSRPFHGTTFEVGTQHMYAPPEPLRKKIPNISPAIEMVVLTALAKDPQKRFGSVQAFALALEQASKSEEQTIAFSPFSSRQSPEGPPLSHSASFYSATTDNQTVEASLPPNLPSVSELPTITVPPIPPKEASPAELTPKNKCPFCNVETRPGDNFCLNCGNRLLPTPSAQKAQQGVGEATLPADENLGEPLAAEANWGGPLAGSLIMPTFPSVAFEVQDSPAPIPSVSQEDQAGAEDSFATHVEDASPQSSSSADPSLELIKAQWQEKGDFYYGKKQFADALIAYEQMIQMDPQNVLIRAKIGNALLRLGQLDDALIAFNHALNIDSDNTAIWAAKGEVLYKLKQYKEALDAYDRAVALSSNAVTIWETKGNVLRNLKRYEESLVAYDRVIDLAPNNAPVWATKGKILFRLERYEEALETFNRASILIPRRTSVWIDKGEVLYKLKRYAEALEAYKRALALKPNDSSISSKCDMLHDLIRHREDLAASQIANWPNIKFPGFNDQLANQYRRSQSYYPDAVHQNKLQKQPLESNRILEYYDVFLIHSHLDAEWVEKNLAMHLEDKYGFRVWLDKWILVPGESWQPAMAGGIDQARCCAVCIGEQTPIGWFKQEIQRALNRQAKDPSFRVIPVLLPNAKSINVDDFLELKTWVDFRSSDYAYAFHLLVCGVKGIPPGKPPSKETTTTQTSTVTEGRLRELQQFRDLNLIDDSVAVEYQRIVLKTLWLGELTREQESTNE